VHFYKNQTTVDKIPPENLIGEAIIVNITEQAMKEPDYKLTVNDLKNWDMAASCFF
jgi:kynurenine formamidase